MYNNSALNNLMGLFSPDNGGSSSQFDRPPLLESARVLAVNEDQFLVTLRTLYTHRLLSNVPVPGAGADGGGNYYFPRIGDICVVAQPTDSDQPWILGTQPIYRTGIGAAGGRRPVRPGDHMISTASGNYVHVARGGFVDISADPITRRMYVPVLHQIRDFFESYFLIGAGGGLEWVSDREDDSTEMRWTLKHKASGKPVVRISAGAVTGFDDLPGTVFYHTQVMSESGEDVADAAFDSDGNVILRARSDIKADAVGLNIVSGSKAVLTTTADDLPARSSIRVSASAGVELANAVEPSVKGLALVALLQEIMAILTELTAASLLPEPNKATVSTRIGSITSRLTTMLAQDVKLS